MKQFYILLLLLLISVRMLAQVCFDITYLTAESRCMATGYISVTVIGGSGSFNYKVVGPVSPAVTSSSMITGLPPGYYTLTVKDLNTGCSVQKDSVFVGGSYNDPRFQLKGTDVSCTGNDGTISVANQQFGRSPFTYTVISPSPASIGQSNTTGNFNSLLPGEYYIQLTDSCGGIQVRRITIQNYNWNINSVTAIKTSCDSAAVTISVIDNKGNTNTNSTAFTGFSYGIVNGPGDTTWFSNANFNAFVGHAKSIKVVVKDNCRNVHVSLFNFPANTLPSVGPVSLTNFTCSTFTAAVTGQQNLTNPTYCLLDSAGNYVECSSTSGIFSNIPYGRYCIKITDGCYDTTLTSCFSSYPSTPSVSNTVLVSNQNCSTFTASITGQLNLRNPYYCIYDSANNLIACDSTGIFNNLSYGQYCIKLNVTCPDSTITRCFTVRMPVAAITSVTFSGVNCSSLNVIVHGVNLGNGYYCLYDSSGTVIACDSTGIFNGIPHGNYCVKAITCSGDTTAPYCFSSAKQVPAVAPTVQITNKICTGFTASITGQSNLTNPSYCLYDSNNVQIICNSTGIFTNIAYGSYCIKITDSCVDTTISRCFTQTQPIPAVTATMQITNKYCNNFSARIIGTNLTNPTYCLFDSTGTQISCDTSGLFTNIPYGYYCVHVHDGCIDTTMQVCQDIEPVRGLTVTTAKNCTVGTSVMTVHFANTNAPFHVQFYHPNGSLIADTVSSVNPVVVKIPALPPGGQYKVIGIDSCGNKDSALITPDALSVTTNTVVSSKCPSGSFLNGAGDVSATYNSNLYGMTPQIISKNNTPDLINYSNHSGNVFTFSDLAPAQYVVQYTMQTCNDTLKDTITVNPYIYPSQGQSAIYQCDNNGFSLNADVTGGVLPYTYQIIGSQPSAPSITTGTQGSPIFNINNGTTYSLVRLRSVDGCGNATLNDVSVLPLQNISIKASSDCYYQNVVLTTDTIPNAVYLWYQRTSATDSVLIDSGLTHNFPFFQPNQVGQYIVKANVNEGCVTRLAYIDLSGNCGYQPLQVPILLKGTVTDAGNILTWTDINEKNIQLFTIERSNGQNNNFKPIVSIPHGNASSFQYTDEGPPPGSNTYRLKASYYNKEAFTNTITLINSKSIISFYPNPVKDVLHIYFNSDNISDYQIEIINANGQKLYQTQLNNTGRTVFDYMITKSYAKGMYLVKVINLKTGKIDIQKIVFQ